MRCGAEGHAAVSSDRRGEVLGNEAGKDVAALHDVLGAVAGGNWVILQIKSLEQRVGQRY